MSYLHFIFKRYRFLFIAVMLLLVNVGVIFSTDLAFSRHIRLASTACFLIFYLVSSKKQNLYVLITLLFFLGKDIAIQGYETYVGNIFYFLFGILAYGTLIIKRLQKLRTIKICNSLIFLFALLITANTYALHTIRDMIDYSFQNTLQIILFYIYGAFMMLITVTAVAYNNLYNSTRSFVFTMLVISFVTSDIASLFAYYYGIDFCYYIDRISYILGFIFFMNYGLNSTLAKEENEQLELLDNSQSNTSLADFKAGSISETKISLFTYTHHKEVN